MGLTALAGLMGLLGSGPLARRESRSADGALRIEYDRFLHRHAPGRLVIELATDARGAAQLWIDRSYVEDARLQRMVPEPESTWGGVDRLLLAFRAVPQGPTRVAIELEPEAFGGIRGTFGTRGGDSISIHQFVYP